MGVANYLPENVHDDIKKLSHDDYKKGAIQFAESFLGKLSNKAALYQFGKVRTPGVSDLDLLVIVGNSILREAQGLASPTINASPLLSQLFLHPPLIVGQSVVEYLPFLHTLENCHQIAGDWDPLADIERVELDLPLKIVRHSVWSSFMRAAALEMDGKEIGLRRCLTLLHNLLTSAHRGSDLLGEPGSISETTEEIRREILNTDARHRLSVIHWAIERVIHILNDIDSRLDESLALSARPIVVPSCGRFLISRLSLEMNPANQGWRDALIGDLTLVRVPKYPVAVAASLARNLDREIPNMKVFSRHRETIRFLEKSIVRYAEKVGSVMRIFEEKNLAYPFVRPFSHCAKRVSLRKKWKQQLQRFLFQATIRQWVAD